MCHRRTPFPDRRSADNRCCFRWLSYRTPQEASVMPRPVRRFRKTPGNPRPSWWSHLRWALRNRSFHSRSQRQPIRLLKCDCRRSSRVAEKLLPFLCRKHLQRLRRLFRARRKRAWLPSNQNQGYVCQCGAYFSLLINLGTFYIKTKPYFYTNSKVLKTQCNIHLRPKNESIFCWWWHPSDKGKKGGFTHCWCRTILILKFCR